MTTLPCPREPELLDALQRGFIGAELSSHVADCASCGELHCVADALLDERVAAITEAPVPTAGAMRWRLEMRLRQDAEAATRRSLLIGQAATLVIALVLAAAFVGSDVVVSVRDVIASIRASTVLLLAAIACVVLAPIGGYIAIRQK